MVDKPADMLKEMFEERRRVPPPWLEVTKELTKVKK
jgi:hypothetical protein